MSLNRVLGKFKCPLLPLLCYWSSYLGSLIHLSSSNPTSPVLFFFLFAHPVSFLMTVLCCESPLSLSLCPIHSLCIFFIVCIRALSSPILTISIETNGAISFLFSRRRDHSYCG